MVVVPTRPGFKAAPADFRTRLTSLLLPVASVRLPVVMVDALVPLVVL